MSDTKTGTLTNVSMKRDRSKLILKGTWDNDKPEDKRYPAFVTVEEAKPLFGAGVITQTGFWPAEGNETPAPKYSVVNKAAVVTIDSVKQDGDWIATVTVGTDATQEAPPTAQTAAQAQNIPPAQSVPGATNWALLKADAALMAFCMAQAKEAIYETWLPFFRDDEGMPRELADGLFAKILEENVKLAMGMHKALSDRNCYIYEDEELQQAVRDAG